MKLKDFAISLEQKTANFQRVEMIVKAHSIPYRVGPYQLTYSRLLAVPLFGKTGLALYILAPGSPSYSRLTFYET